MSDVKRLVFAIMRFLADQKVGWKLDEDSLGNLEIGLKCLSNAYGIDMTDPSQIAKYQVQRSLLNIFNLQIGCRGLIRRAVLMINKMEYVNKLMFAILRFLEGQKVTVTSLQVGIQSLSNAYDIDMTNPDQIAKYRIKKNLLDLFNAQLSLDAAEERKQQAEEKKATGNECMKSEKYSDAVEFYTQAIKLDNKNPVYYYNRAAAYTKLNKHDLSIEDCQRALSIDPSYTKAYGRIGIGYAAQGHHRQAIEYYRKALEYDPGNQFYQRNLKISVQTLKERAARKPDVTVSGMESAFGTLFNDPAYQMMAESLMQTPAMQQMIASSQPNHQTGRDLLKMDVASMVKHPAYMQMTSMMSQQPAIQQMMANIMKGVQIDEVGVGHLQVGMKQTDKIQENPPDLMDQLGEQMARMIKDNPNYQSQGGNPPPPQPPAE